MKKLPIPFALAALLVLAGCDDDARRWAAHLIAA